jgi:hypothetical protein
MKKFTNKITILFAVIALGSLTLLSSCSKDEAATNTAPSSSTLAAGKCTISFNYSGKVSGSFSSMDLGSVAVKTSGYGNITGSALSGTSVSQMLFLQPHNQTGTINFKTIASTALNTVTFTQGATGWAASAGDDFTIVFTKCDGLVVEATFSGTMTNSTDKSTVTITNGKIAAKY